MSGILVAPTFVSTTNLRDVNDAAKADGKGLTWDSASSKHVYTSLVTGTSTDFVLVDGSQALTANWDAGSYAITAETFVSDVSTGTAPLTVSSTTKVTNLNADQVDGLDSTDLILADGSQELSSDWDAGANAITAETFVSDVSTGTAPLTVSSTTKVTNLNADLLDGQEGSYYATAADVAALTSGYARRQAVIARVDNTAAPPTEVSGDRYLLDATGASHAEWDGAAANDIVEFNGSTWDATNPVEGWLVYSDGSNSDWLYVDDGSGAWSERAVASTDHGSLSGLTDDDHTQYSLADGTRWTDTQTASRAVVTDSSGNLVVSDVTSTELGYLDGVTSAIQTQINGISGGGASATLARVAATSNVDLTDASWDVSKGSYAEKSLDIASESINPQSIRISADGTKAYILSATVIKQYTLSVAGDISTGTYASKNLSVNGQEATPTAFTFNSDGSIVYAVGTVNDTVYQYTLSVEWDISTASYASKSMSVNSQLSAPSGLWLNADGDTMFVCGQSNNNVYQYTLSTPDDVSTGSYASKSFDGSGSGANPQDIFVSSDESRLFISDTGDDLIYQFLMSTPGDISTASYENKTLDVSNEDGSGYGVAFNAAGDKVYVAGLNDDSVYQYNLENTDPSPVDGLTLADDDIVLLASQTDAAENGLYTAVDTDDPATWTRIDDMAASDDASGAFVVVTEGSRYGATLWHCTNASGSAVVDTDDLTFANTGDAHRSPQSIIARLVATSNIPLSAEPYELSLGFYASKSLTFTTQEGSPRAMAMSSDGTKAYVIGTVGDTIYQYTLSTAWDVSTASYASKSMSTASEENSVHGMAISSDGAKVYVLGQQNTTVYQYTLSTPGDISTGSYDSKSMSVSGQISSAQDMAISADGSKIYTIGNSNNTVYQYTLSTPYDVSTGSYASKSMSVSSQETTSTGVIFSSDGSNCYVIGQANDTIYRYSLSSAWDISTGSYASDYLAVNSQDGTPVGLGIKSDGTAIYMCGDTGNKIYQYTLGTPPDPGTVDSVSLSDGDILLLNGQTTASEKGVYDCVDAADPSTWIRHKLADGMSASGTTVRVTAGTTNATSTWVCTTLDGSDIVGTDSLTFTEF